jgi:hypothetical protein
LNSVEAPERVPIADIRSPGHVEGRSDVALHGLQYGGDAYVEFGGRAGGDRGTMCVCSVELVGVALEPVLAASKPRLEVEPECVPLVAVSSKATSKSNG